MQVFKFSFSWIGFIFVSSSLEFKISKFCIIMFWINFIGLMPVNRETLGLFFWYFPAQIPTANSTFFIFLQGGPGSSSSVGMFYEVGPFTIYEGMLKCCTINKATIILVITNFIFFTSFWRFENSIIISIISSIFRKNNGTRK